MAKQQKEFLLQATICEWLRLQYPKVMFLSDVRASMKLSIPQQVRSKRIQADDFACPDLMIFHPNKHFHGMFLELKSETPWKKAGGLKKDAHLERQFAAIMKLLVLRYYANFYWDFEYATEAIRKYFKNEIP